MAHATDTTATAMLIGVTRLRVAGIVFGSLSKAASIGPPTTDTRGESKSYDTPARLFSQRRIICLRAVPQRYPPSFPPSRNTRWQGMTQATGLAPTALPTARAPFDFPRRRASALYVTVAPGPSSSSARQTWTWKLVP